jgi:hypothetical protein
LRRQRLLHGFRAIAAFPLLLAGATVRAQPTETAVKAAFLPKFLAYVEWPPTLRLPAGAHLNLCVIGTDPFGRALDEAVRGQQVDGHPVAVKRLPGAQGADGCQAAFVNGSGGRGIAEMLAALQGKPVLTVTDARAGPQRGIIHFVLAQGRVRFVIDQAAAQRDGLALSARLLAVALEVRGR